MTRALLPLVPLYAAAVGAKNLAYARGWRRAHRLAGPVISIGNLSVGGSGKTPLTIRLSELLQGQGIAADVLSRGYGRSLTEVRRVDPAGSADDYGDEPLLIAQTTGVPVYVGPSRYAAGCLAESGSPVPRVHLLDDGFQHRQLARDVDIVVLHRSDFAAQLLPAGRLREPFSSLSRAQIVVLREEDRDLLPELRARGCSAPVWFASRTLAVPPVRRAVAFCAIARPDEFFFGLRAEGVTLLATRSWRDHHQWSQADIAALVELQRQHQAEAFLTTQKDLVRLHAEQRHALESAAPLDDVPLAVRLADEPSAIAQVLDLLPRSASPPSL
ncbi:MAG TPA: tetraacyldisaccharide 4'-kinase [Acidobacteriaceae bacterium]|nr:tetraacyldisaccharide 4'-kinase [Acidobacteriaceae bacterium]